ncbi:MAG: energy transducer TonB [Betaproteobacteria bacterium]|nr:energy transducer TonB [Betaproteobacteria bacterium]
MVPSLTLLSPGEIPRPTRRLILGLAFSLAAHAALMAGLRPMAPVDALPTPRAPLRVEISRVAPEAGVLLASPAAPDRPADAAAAPAATVKAEPAPPPKTAVAPATGLELRIPLDEYYTARELDVRAEPLNDVDLVYPRLAYQSRVRGKVTLRILINERGGLDGVSVLAAEPRGLFEEAALTATRALQFSPALKHGRRVKSQKTIEVAFDPYENIHIP